MLTLLAALLVAAGAAFSLLEERRAVRRPAWTRPVVGLLSGVLAGLSGTGGPPLIFYYLAGGGPAACESRTPLRSAPPRLLPRRARG